MLENAIMEKDFQTAKKIILSGNFNKRGRAIILAVRFSQPELVRLLISNKADINVKDVHGKTALSWAIELDEKETIHTLINAGATSPVRTKFFWCGH